MIIVVIVVVQGPCALLHSFWSLSHEWQFGSSGFVVMPGRGAKGSDTACRFTILAFRVFPLFLLLAITALGGPEGYFGLAVAASGAFEFIVPNTIIA